MRRKLPQNDQKRAQGNLQPLPDGVAWSAFSLAEPLSCVIAGQVAAGVKAGDSVLIYGVGPMGLLHVMAASAAGAQTIIVVDPKIDRLEMAMQLGATHTIQAKKASIPEAIANWSGGKGLDVVITATPAPEIVSEALDLLGTFGRLCLFAGLSGDSSRVFLDANRIHYRSISVVGTTGGRLPNGGRDDLKQSN